MANFFDLEIEENKGLDKRIKKIQKEIAKGSVDYFLYKDHARLLLKIPSFTNVKIALDSINQFLKFKPEDVKTKILKARALRLLNKNEEALSILERMKENDKDNPEIEDEIGRNFLFQNNLNSAKKILKDAYKKFPNNHRLGRALVRYYTQTNQLDKGLFLSNKLLTNNPKDWRSIQNNMIILRKLQRPKDAIEVGEKFMENFPNECFAIGFTSSNQFTSVASSLAKAYQGYANRQGYKTKHNVIQLNDQDNIIITINSSNAQKLFYKKSIRICDKIIYKIKVQFQNINENSLTNIKDLKINSLIQLREFHESVLLCDEILSYQNNVSIRFLKGFSLFHLEKYNDALENFNAIFKEFPNKQINFYRLCCYKKCYSKLEFMEEKKKYSEKYDKKDTEGKNVKAKIIKTGIITELEDINEYHTMFYINKLENMLRNFIYSIFENNDALIKKTFPDIYKKILQQQKKDEKLLYEFEKNNPLVSTTLGELYDMLNNNITKNKLKKQECNKQMEDFKMHLVVVLTYRNPQGHSKGLDPQTGDLPTMEKGMVVGASNSCIKFLEKFSSL